MAPIKLQKSAFLTVFVSLVIVVQSAELPANIQKCAPGDSPCLVEVSNKVIRESSAGNAGLNLAPVDPLKIERIDIEQDPKSPVNINLHFRNVSLTGLSKLVVYEMNGFDGNITSPKEMKAKLIDNNLMVIDADYTVNGKILLLPIVGEGKCQLKFHNWDAAWKMVGSPVQKNGKEYIKVDRSKLNFSISRLSSNFENLFNGDKQLSDTMNLFLNENWEEIVNELRPALSETISQILAGIISGPFSKIPYKELFASS